MSKLFFIILIFSSFPLLSQHVSTAAEKLFTEGNNAHSAGRYKEALALYNECLKQHPGYTEAYLARAATREQLQDLTGALTDYSIYLETYPENFEALFSRANVRFKLKKYEQAKDDYLKLLDLPTGETNTIFYQTSPRPSGSNQFMTAQSIAKPMLFNYLGLTETKLKRYKSAIQWLDSAISIQPREADYYVNRGIAREGLNENATEDYKQALRINPHHTIALHNLGVMQRKQGVKEDNYLEQAIESDSTMLYPYLERAYQRMQGGYYKGAFEDYTKALAIDETDPEIWLNRGLSREKLNDLKGAYADYTNCIKIKEDYEKAWLNRGNVLNKQGLYKEAIEDYTLAITYNSTYSSAYYNRAIAKERLKQFAAACADLKQAEALGKKADGKLKRKVCAE